MRGRLSEIEPNAAAGLPQHSGWHSPVPYLFGGLAAMLGLVGLALLILACSYWKISASLEDGGETAEGVNRNRQGGTEEPTQKEPSTLEAKVVVIMAGDDKPTYLATPVSTPAILSGDINKESEMADNSHEEEREDEKTECRSD